METFKEQFFHMWQVGDLVDNLSGFWPTLLELFIRHTQTVPSSWAYVLQRFLLK